MAKLVDHMNPWPTHKQRMPCGRSIGIALAVFACAASASTLLGCVALWAEPPLRASVGVTTRSRRTDNASTLDARPDYRIALHPLQPIHPKSRYVDVGVGYLVQPGAPTHQTGYVELSARVFQRQIAAGDFQRRIIAGDWDWRLSLGIQARREYEAGLGGFGFAAQAAFDLATFANFNDCGILARGDLALGTFLEASYARLDGMSVSALTTGFSLRAPLVLAASIEHDPCLSK